MNAALEVLAREAQRLGYRADAILRDYAFSDVVAADPISTRRAPLAVFSQTPPSYRSAAFGAARSEAAGAEATVRAYRSLGAPLFFVIEESDVSIWQVYAGGPPRQLDRVPFDAIQNLFRSKEHVWSPDAIHRAKSIGRFNATYQLDFVDVGLIPAIEGQIHEKLDRLLQQTLAATRDSATPVRGSALFQGVFRLLAAKVLIDRQHAAASKWQTSDVSSVLKGIGDYYGLPHEGFDLHHVADKLAEAWHTLSSGLNVANISADDLAFVYENTLVTPETRRAYGTHSTPRHVAEYITGRLELWRDAANPPRIFEPFAGAGVFLVSALRHLREALPHSWSDRQRHDFLVGRIRGAEIDTFACEVATLSLILADYPNKNGWNIENVDLFRDHLLAERLAQSRVILCNPPFEIFTSDERAAYPEMAALSGSKALAVLRSTLATRPHSLGFVLPRSFLMDRAYREERRLIERLYREVELVSLPDGVFSVSQMETALLIARELGAPRSKQLIRASEVDDKDRRNFVVTGLPTRVREETRELAPLSQGNLWLPPLSAIWRRLASTRRLRELVDGHWGLRWIDGGQGRALKEGPGSGRAIGLLRATDHHQFKLGKPVWLDINPAHLYAGGSLPWGKPKILCNAARLSRSNWRLAAAVDYTGLFASQQFVGLWPRETDTDLDAIAAVLNGPLANAFVASHSTEKRFRIANLLDIPIPQTIPTQIGNLAREYAARVNERNALSDDEQLARLLDEIDTLVLEAYDLPPRLCRELLLSFSTAERPVAHHWRPWNISEEDPAVSLAELHDGAIERARGNWIREHLKPVSREEAAAAAPYLP